MINRTIRTLVAFILCTTALARAADEIQPVQFETETLDNGLTVIYAPLHQAPVVHVRVLYHVGSRDELPDRQGFAHMFEHMMFRGSAHVTPEQHMKLVMQVGGTSNAFTSFDQTTYWESLPANNTEMALYLEADRMASFKVSDDIFKTERKVVAEEWRMRYANQPYGPMFEDLAKTAFKIHSYHWTPIGNMDQLREAASSELQEFFNQYYVPNNACLIIAGDIDIAQTKTWVRKYYGWIPRGGDITRRATTEPAQNESRELIVKKPSVPLTVIDFGYKTPNYRDDDHYALNMLGTILAGGRSSRLDSALVNSDDPLCSDIGASDYQLEDPSLFVIQASALPGKDPQKIRDAISIALADLVNKGVTQQELDLARAQAKIDIIHSRETAQSIATGLGESQVFGGDANRVNTEWEKYQSLTPQQVTEVAKTYFTPEHLTVLEYLPDATAPRAAAATQAAAKANETATASVAPSTEPIAPRVSDFPKDWPTNAPLEQPTTHRPFEKGVELSVNGVRVLVMADHRLPVANFSLVMRAGGHAGPAEKEGAAAMTASLIRRGAGDMSFLQLAEDLDSRGISIDAGDYGDNTRLFGNCPADQIDHTIDKLRDILLHPQFSQEEFDRLKAQSLAGLQQQLSDPNSVASREMTMAMYGSTTPLGRQTTQQTLNAIQLQDVKDFYGKIYRPNDAILVFSGDVTPEQGKMLAEKLLADWKPASALPNVDYQISKTDTRAKRRVILIDNPAGKQSTIRVGGLAFPISSDEKFPGSLAGRILSDGIHARLDRYLRAERGYTYGAAGYFSPNRHAGEFGASVATQPQTTGPCIEAMFKVFELMDAQNVNDIEMNESKSRTAGLMVMQMQTISQQVAQRIEGILNGYPLDYYDVYPQRISQVSADQVRDVMSKYVKPDMLSIVVVGPGDQVKAQLEKFGDVEVMPMPLKRGSTTGATMELR